MVRKHLIIFALVASSFGIPQPVLADAPVLLFSEIKIKNDSSGYDEFLELRNMTEEVLNLNEYYIAYANTPAPTADEQISTAVIASGQLEAGKSLVLAKNPAQFPEIPALTLPFSSLADAGGLLRLLDSEGTILDDFAWTGTASTATPSIYYLSSTTLNRSQSFSRNLEVDDLSTSNWQLLTPSPISSVLLPVPSPPETTEPDTLATDETTDVIESTPDVNDNQTTNSQSLSLIISELLPNPAAPASDDSDEFIELYNPYDQAVELTGSKLQTGNTFAYSYTFPETTIPAQSYLVLYVGTTKLTLSNSAGQARLLSPAGLVMSRTEPYAQAPAGQAWALVSGSWQWTTAPTPGLANLLGQSKIAASTAAKATSKSSSKAPKTKTTAKQTPTTSEADAASVADKPVKAVHVWILAAIGTLTLLYAAYEYRHDLRNLIYKFRRHRKLRRSPGQQVARG